MRSRRPNDDGPAAPLHLREAMTPADLALHLLDGPRVERHVWLERLRDAAPEADVDTIAAGLVQAGLVEERADGTCACVRPEIARWRDRLGPAADDIVALVSAAQQRPGLRAGELAQAALGRRHDSTLHRRVFAPALSGGVLRTFGQAPPSTRYYATAHGVRLVEAYLRAAAVGSSPVQLASTSPATITVREDHVEIVVRVPLSQLGRS